MSTSFSSYIEGDSGLHRLHPLTKLYLSALFLVAALTLPGIWASYLVFVSVLVPISLWGRISQALLRVIFRVVLPFAISLFLIQGFLWPGGTPILEIGPASLKLEGLLFSIRGTGRILLVVSSFLLLTFATRPDALMQALGERGVPKNITYIILTTIQIVPRFQTKASTIIDAQRSRGLRTEGRIWQRARGLVPLVLPLVLGSIVDIEERAIALEVRAFGRQGPKTYLVQLIDSRAQAAARWLIVLAAIFLVAGRILLWR